MVRDRVLTVLVATVVLGASLTGVATAEPHGSTGSSPSGIAYDKSDPSCPELGDEEESDNENWDVTRDGDINDTELRTSVVAWSKGCISDDTLQTIIVEWSS